MQGLLSNRRPDLLIRGNQVCPKPQTHCYLLDEWLLISFSARMPLTQRGRLLQTAVYYCMLEHGLACPDILIPDLHLLSAPKQARTGCLNPPRPQVIPKRGASTATRARLRPHNVERSWPLKSVPHSLPV